MNSATFKTLLARAAGLVGTGLAFIGALTVLFFVLLFSAGKNMGEIKMMPDKIILAYEFNSTLSETQGRPSLDRPLLKPQETIHDVTAALTTAARDPRVLGFIARLEDIRLAPAEVRELREAVAAFRAGGKTAEIFSASLDGMGEYYLASNFDRIWLQPVGIVAANGIGAEIPFARGVLEKIGLTADIMRRGVYKSMPESLTAERMSDESRRMTEALVKGIAGTMTAEISAARKITAETMQKIIDGAPYTDVEALNLSLIDKIGYADEMREEALKKHGLDEDAIIDLADYAAARRHGRSGKKIALISGSGELTAEGGEFSAKETAETFNDAVKDKNVAAIVFRINSPGGSPAAAETVRRAVIRAQEKGKPVVVSMGGAAASGGYWAASGAKKIVAQPTTITGSIGVFGGKIVAENLWKKLGINWETVKSGENAGMMSVNRPFTPAERARFEAQLNAIYDAFITRVAEGRGMPREKAQSLAEGYVFTGAQAKENELVDALGGIETAAAMAREAAGIGPDEETDISPFPPAKTPLEIFIKLAAEGVFFMPLVDIRALGETMGLANAYSLSRIQGLGQIAD